MRKGLTARAVEAAQPAAERREIADGYLPGLYLLVQPKPSGAKGWAVRFRLNGTTRKFTLGPYPAIDLKAARELGAKALRMVAEGKDPGHERAQARASQPDSIESVAEQFIERHCQRVNRPKTARETERLLRRNVLPYWKDRSIDSITRRDVLAVLDRVVDSGARVEANRVLAATRKMFAWAVARDVIAISPCAGVKPPSAEQSRDRVLNDDELRLVWQAAEKIGYPFGPLAQLLVLLAQRRDEVGRMRWSELDLEKRLLWTLPRERVKTNQPHEVPLSVPAVDILKSLPPVVGSDFVFSTNGATAVSGYSKAKRNIDALLPADMPPWRLHDLRRTAASGMARLGVSLHVVEKVLNHTCGSFRGVVGIYQRYEFAGEKRTALSAWAQHINSLISETSSTVLLLRAGPNA
jgi:integrase